MTFGKWKQRKDRTLPHQIVLNFQGRTGHVVVCCNCTRDHNGNFIPLAVLETNEDAWGHYNDPRNHRPNKGIIFDYEDQAGPPQTRIRRTDFEALLVQLVADGVQRQEPSP